MSYNDKKRAPKRDAFTLFSMELDINDPALDDEFALEPDSYGTPKTTEDTRAYTGVDFKSYSYAEQNLFGIDHFPGLMEVDTNPPEVKPGESIGFRASATVRAKDFLTNDAFELPDAYADRRVTATHFGKLFARNYIKNRIGKVIRGYDPNAFDLNNARVENYVIDKWSGPDIRGNIRFDLADVLVLTNSKNAKAPSDVSKGTLVSDINATVTSIDYTSSVPDEYGTVDATGVIAIGKEQMTYTVATAGTSGTLTVVRSEFGSPAESHSAGDTIQKCIYYNNENIMDIFSDIIQNYTDIPNSYIPTTEWNALKTGDLSIYNFTRVITKPTEVKKLLNELVQHGGLSVYTDVVAQKIKVVANPPFESPVITFNEREHIEQNSLSVEPAFDKLMTRQAIYWSKRNFAEGSNEQYYGKRFAVIDGFEEAGANLGVKEEGPVIKSDWLPNTTDGNQVATTIVQRNVNRFSAIPEKVSFEVDSRYVGDLENGGHFGLGEVFAIETSLRLNPDASKKTLIALCTKLSPTGKDDKWKVEGLAYRANIPANVDFYIDEDKIDYVLADDPDFSPILADGAREYVVVINSGVTIGQDVNDHAFKQGDFPVGATLKVINAGRVLGKGGKGGKGADIAEIDTVCTEGGQGAGFDGGNAWEFTTDVIIDNSLGLIGGGGGGGTGGLASCALLRSGAGGGGGQGSLGGPGGDPGDISGISATPGASGSPGTAQYPGAGGSASAGAGGELGQAGAGASGGQPGVAITTSGNTVTIIAGNNSEQIKGAIV